MQCKIKCKLATMNRNSLQQPRQYCGGQRTDWRSIGQSTAVFPLQSDTYKSNHERGCIKHGLKTSTHTCFASCHLQKFPFMVASKHFVFVEHNNKRRQGHMCRLFDFSFREARSEGGFQVSFLKQFKVYTKRLDLTRFDSIYNTSLHFCTKGFTRTQLN